MVSYCLQIIDFILKSWNATSLVRPNIVYRIYSSSSGERMKNSLFILRHVPKKFRTMPFQIVKKKNSNVANPRFLYISRKFHPSTLQIGPYQISKWRGVRDMSVERGPCKIMLKTDFGRFLAKLLIFQNFQYTIGKVLKNDVIGEKIVGIFSATVQIRRFFV